MKLFLRNRDERVLVLFLIAMVLVNVLVWSNDILLFLEDSNNEKECVFVSSRGILKSSNVYPTYPISSVTSLDYTNWNVKENDIVYIQGSALRDFIFNMMPRIKTNFTLVTGDCDESMPYSVLDRVTFSLFIKDRRLKHWYSQNLVVKHPKATIIPIGLDYHSEAKHIWWGPPMDALQQEAHLLQIANNALPLMHRSLLCYVNFKHALYTHHSSHRLNVLKSLNQHLLFVETEQKPRLQSWQTQSMMSFVISPFGMGLDCHRTWEAMILGCIPIVQSSAINHLFEDLPVLIVSNWSLIDLDLLHKTRIDFHNRKWNREKLTLQYWMSIIKG
jgi:hypothetical protein